MNKIERLMNTIIILKTHPGIQVESLARILDISNRTIYRDFSTLSFAPDCQYTLPPDLTVATISMNTTFFPL